MRREVGRPGIARNDAVPGLEVGKPPARVQRAADHDRHEDNPGGPRNARDPLSDGIACPHVASSLRKLCFIIFSRAMSLAISLASFECLHVA